VFNNGAHDSVGGQLTVGYKTDMQNIAKANNYKLTLQAKTIEEIVNCIRKLRQFKGTAFLEILVKKGFRKDLGRPTTTPKENKENLMKFIKEKL
jgi:phosphonopyruvate decarboxylase